MEPIREYWYRVLAAISSIRRLFDELLRERELILRSQGRVHFVPLTRRLQLCALIVVLVVAGWGIGMTLMSTVKSSVIAVKNDEIREARVAYEDLFEEVLRYQKKIAAVTTTLRKSQEELLAEVGASANAVHNSKKGKSSVKHATGAAAAEKQVLRESLGEIDHKVQQMTETNSLLEGSLNKIKSELKLAGDERDKIIKTRNMLRDRVEQLEEMLIKARTENTYLDRRVASLNTDLTQSRKTANQVTTQRDSLQSRVSGLENNAKDANGRAKSAEADLKKVLSKLEESTGGFGTTADADVSDNSSSNVNGSKDGDDTAALRRRTVALLQRLDDLHAAQGNVLDRLGERTVNNIQEAENLIKMTGLNVKKILARATRSISGQGGPLFEIPDGADVSGLPVAVSTIDTQLTRWNALRAALERIPLISPVDFYHLASGYGLRTDPMTHRRAMHYGLDLAGWLGAPVYATAPGKVVFAGRKGRYGKMVEIDHGYGIRTRYGHLKKVLVHRGEEVGHRHEIGLLGSTGRSTGPHVHYEVRFDGKPIDPEKFIKAGRYVFKSQQDGS